MNTTKTKIILMVALFLMFCGTTQAQTITTIIDDNMVCSDQPTKITLKIFNENNSAMGADKIFFVAGNTTYFMVQQNEEYVFFNEINIYDSINEITFFAQNTNKTETKLVAINDLVVGNCAQQKQQKMKEYVPYLFIIILVYLIITKKK